MTPDSAPAETLKLLPESTPVLRFVYISVWLEAEAIGVDQRCTQTGVPESTPAGVSMFQPELNPES